MTESSTQDWPERNWAVAILGALVGLAIQQLADGKMDDVMRPGLASALMTGGVAFAFTLDRDRIRLSAAFAAFAGVSSSNRNSKFSKEYEF